MTKKKINIKIPICLGIIILIICFVFFCFHNYNKSLSGKATNIFLKNDSFKIQPSELVKPAIRNPDSFKDALCNDGTPFAFIVEETNSKKWLIYLKGGGFCEDNALFCKERISTRPDLITTLEGEDGQTTKMPRAGIFSRDKSVNPNLFNANFVYAHYCSSDAWTGSVTQAKNIKGEENISWYFTGKINVESMIKILKSQYGLDDDNPNTEVILVGTSAGAMGAIANAETLSNELPKTATKKRLKIISDGAFLPNFSDSNYPVGNSNDSLNEMFIKAYGFWNSSLNSYCEENQIKEGNPKGNCFMSSIMLEYITGCKKGLCLPLLIQTSIVDNFFLNFHHITPENIKAQEKWKKVMLAELGNANIFWLFSSEKRYHTLITQKDVWNSDSKNNDLNYGKIINMFLKEANKYEKMICIYNDD